MFANIKIRQYLNSLGFFQEKGSVESGNIYMYAIPDSNAKFVIDLSKCFCDAYYPDYKYNKTNPYSTKETVVTFSWKSGDDEDLVVENLKEFLRKIISIIERN